MKITLSILAAICLFAGGFTAGRKLERDRRIVTKKLLDSLSLPVQWEIHNDTGDRWILEVYREKTFDSVLMSYGGYMYSGVRYRVATDTLNKYFSFIRPMYKAVDGEMLNGFAVLSLISTQHPIGF